MNYTLMLGSDQGMAPTITARLSKGEYGTPQPELIFAFPRKVAWREIEAVVHHYAACVSLRTPQTEHWLVQMATWNDGGLIYLELDKGTEREAKAGVAMLQELATQDGPQGAPRK